MGLTNSKHMEVSIAVSFHLIPMPFPIYRTELFLSHRTTLEPCKFGPYLLWCSRMQTLGFYVRKSAAFSADSRYLAFHPLIFVH